MNQTNKCRKCGGGLTEENGEYTCPYCRAKFKKESVMEDREEILSLFGAALYMQKEEQIANIRQNLWQAVHEEYTDSEKIVEYCRALKKLLPEDFQANFYEIANNDSAGRINRFLDKIDVAQYGEYVEDVLKFMLKSLERKNISAVKNLIERAKDFGIFTKPQYIDYITQTEDEAVRLDNGMYATKLPRDVFLAYSSRDMESVNELTEYLEGQKISCFTAFRNLRHGRGSVQDYKPLLHEAMHNCKCVVFLSSESSRSLDCDALEEELPYIRDNEPTMGRIEYILEEYGKNTTTAAKTLLKEFFDGQEWCRTREDLIKRILDCKTGKKTVTVNTPAVKYCISCGTGNPVAARYCLECGSNKFVGTSREFANLKAASERKAAEEEFSRRQREMEEVFARKQREAEAERQKQQRELEKLKSLLAEKEKNQPENRPQKKADGPESSKADVPERHQIISTADFTIIKGVLTDYKGKGGNVVIPDGVTSIDYCALRYKGLTGVTVPDSVTSIGKAAFYGNNNLKSVIIGNGVISIGENAFDNCGNLISVRIGKGLTGIGDGAFSHCKSLTSISMPDSVKSIGRYAFFGCNSLTRIVLPDSVKTIGEGAFGCCSNLISVTIPAGVTNMCGRVFRGCHNLTIYCKAQKPLFGYPKGWRKDWLRGSKNVKIVWAGKEK